MGLCSILGFTNGHRAQRGAAKLLATRVKDVMTDYVLTIPPEKTVVEAAAMMVGEDVSTLVVEKEEKPIGILTERDFIMKVPASQKALKLTVGEVTGAKASRPLITVTPEMTLKQARDALKQHKIRKLVVVDKEGRAIGIVTQTDLSKALYKHVTVVAQVSDGQLHVEDVMTTKLVAVEKRAGFATAKRLMMQHHLSAIPVTERHEYVGIFTEYDVVTQFYDAGGRLDIKEIPELMKTPIKAIPADLNIFDANTIMLFEKVRRLMVVEGKKVVGVVTQTDLVHACFDYAEMLRERHARGEQPRRKDFITLRKRDAIISEYAGEHVRAFTMR